MTARNHFYSTSLSLWLAGWMTGSWRWTRAKIIIYTVSPELSHSLYAYQAVRRGADLCLQLKLRVCCWSIIGTERCAAG